MNTRNQQTEELEILREAIDALTTDTGIQIEIGNTKIPTNEAGVQADAMINIGTNKGIYVETKRYAQHANIGAIINQMRRLPGIAMFVADYINPRMAEKLRQENIQFIDTAGNAYINLDPIYIYIAGKKQNKGLNLKTMDRANRAFEPKGLMVTYGFLTDPDLLNRPYREIAMATDVALGTVGWVLKALKAGGYIQDELREKHRHITNYQMLLNRWVEAWPEKLKPKFYLGTFLTDDPHWWENIKIEQYGGKWGGETAAALYTNYLKPEIATVYIPKHKFAKLAQDMRLRKEPKINRQIGSKVNIYTPFWPQDQNQILDEETINKIEGPGNNRMLHRNNAIGGVVNPVLAYADLIATGDARNLEAAEILYNEHIARPNA